MQSRNGKAKILRPCDYGVVRNGELVHSTNDVCIAGYTSVGTTPHRPQVQMYDYNVHKMIPNPAYAEWLKASKDNKTRIDVVYYVVTNGGHDRWVDWYINHSPMAKFFDKTPLIVDGVDIHSIEFRQNIGLIFTPDECKSMRANHMFGLIKGFRIGWSGESRANVDAFFKLLDGGADERAAFRLAMSLRWDDGVGFASRNLAGHHVHFWSSDDMVVNMFKGVYDTTKMKPVVDGPTGYTWWDGADKVFGVSRLDQRDIFSELNTATNNKGCVTSRFGAKVNNPVLDVVSAVAFANAYVFNDPKAPNGNPHVSYDDDDDEVEEDYDKPEEDYDEPEDYDDDED